ncbi:MAG: ATP synthase F1 subunit gamma [Anaerolineae bacterium]|jgi:F-type H+-transporting ATPase subunit gamma|nr:ATP synthase F1 subunit gamma [Anaerolineae bacterium]
MPPLREVRNRIKSVKNISQITRALEAVSASRVRKAQARVLASRAYAQKAWEILLNIQNASAGAVAHPLLMERETIQKVLVVLITSDRGLAGSYNANIIRVTERFTERIGRPVQYVTVGRKGRDSLVRAGEPVIAEFSDMPAEPRISDVAPIARLAIDAFLKGDVDEVLIAYTDFVNMLAQRPTVLPWLPLTTHAEARRVAGEFIKDVPQISSSATNYDYEPSAAAVLDEIVPRFTELQLYQALLEAQASEHAARMSAMKNATDNASQLIGDLTLEYNKARQASITSEILDIVGGANALQQSIDNMAAAIVRAADQAVAVASPMLAAVAAPAPVRSAAATQILPAQAEAPAPPARKGGREAPAGDNLKVVEGIGPKMEAALKAAGIDTYVKLAEATEDELRAAINAAGMKLAPGLGTWAKQSRLAAEGAWAALEDYKNTLVGGREPDA